MTRALGACLFLLGMLGAAWTAKASFDRRGLVSAALALAAPVLLVAGVVGGVLVLVPDFFP